MSRDEVRAMFVEEQQAFVALARGLAEEQWVVPSLCRGWTVLDVVRHTAVHTHRAGLREILGNSERVSARLVAREHAETPAGLVAWFAAPAPDTAATSRINLCELVVHQQDVRRPLGLPRAASERAVRISLDVSTGAIGNAFVFGRMRRLGRGLYLSATDMDWATGHGPEVYGTGEEILMAIAGRRSVSSLLTGPGVAVLEARLQASETMGADVQ